MFVFERTLKKINCVQLVDLQNMYVVSPCHSNPIKTT